MPLISSDAPNQRLHSQQSPFQRTRQLSTQIIQRSRSLWLMLLLSLLLSGCVRYDVGVRFDSSNGGEFVQHIQIEERLKQFSGGTAQQWLALIKERTQRLGGRLEQLPDDDLLVTIPFTSSGELQTKFNQFFSPLENDSPTVAAAIALPPVASRFTIATSNLLLVERNHLRYDLDLRSLGVLSSSGSVLLSPASLLGLEFRLHTPWGAKSTGSAINQPDSERSGKTLVWQLVPGALNHLEVVFWLPSPLGFGTLAIVLLVVVGRYLKYPPSDTFSHQASAFSPKANADS
ncbi:DUF3153 domain-containing protein [Leptolyngbya sp. FACHB-321]|uniref:DUF3153 domain-containing protein n=1 Tax=Leptolyngbya sp. FACHB-321 TaxID=2692807 RepID=UPI001682C4F7|nr:DUF3153 domain-containing protein [Leptolyngbya sp. FACHB-321]MBD2036460.1 DUF3153 domain-containing protein [Leptolyngbya sp. FACHB-321]